MTNATGITEDRTPSIGRRIAMRTRLQSRKGWRVYEAGNVDQCCSA